MQAQMLAPAAVLVVWTLIVLLWIVPSRLGAAARIEDKSKLPTGPGVRGGDLDPLLPPRASWPAHNHTHLHEQPTLFYAVSLILAVVGAGAIDVLAAWIYVGLRIVHSLWQIWFNTVPVRFALFLGGTVALGVLAVRAVIATLFADPGALPT